jgi:hypothetical protein
MSSSSSVTSFASSGSAASGARRIVPLYNLHAHNVMTNTVTDAGTDAKVAKFAKRGLEIIGVGFWEPIEVWPASSTGLSAQESALATTTNPGGMTSLSSDAEGAILTPTSSISHLSFVDHEAGATASPDPAPSTPESTGPKKLFGKMFKKKDSNSKSPTIAGFLSPLSPSTPSHSRTHTRTSSTNAFSIPIPLPSTPKSPSASASEHLLPSVLGLQPLLSLAPDHHPTSSPHIYTTFTSSPPLPPSTYPPHGRATTYTWVLRKWAKEKHVQSDTFLGALGIHAPNLSGGNGSSSPEIDVDVRIQWVRGKVPVSRKPATAEEKKSRRQSTIGGGEGVTPTAGSAASSRRTSAIYDSAVERTRSVSPSRKRLSMTLHPSPTLSSIKRSSTSSQKRPSMEFNRDGTPSSEVDEESDPEDSETPWSCTLHVVPPSAQHIRSRSHFPSLGSRNPFHSKHATEGVVPETINENGGVVDRKEGRLKVKVASLIPAPHHPKVLGQLKMPFPVPDVNISMLSSTATLYPRTLTPEGIVRRSEIPVEPGSILLSAEELKDVISSTAFWLIVREGFGGIGKVKRKGDGWRIRG